MEDQFKNYERAKEVCIVVIHHFLVSSLKCYEAAIEANPEHANAHYNLGKYIHQSFNFDSYKHSISFYEYDLVDV